MNDALNQSVIRGHEGERLAVYRDTRGRATIGVGFNLDAEAAPTLCQALHIDYHAVYSGAPITPAQSDAIFAAQYDAVAAQALHVFPEIDTYPDNAAAVVCDMIFELGFAGFLAFRRFIALIGTHAWKLAAADLGQTYLAQEVPGRVKDNIALLEAIA